MYKKSSYNKLITRLGNAFESVVSNPESVCEEIKNSLQEEIADSDIDCQFAICETCFWSGTVFKWGTWTIKEQNTQGKVIIFQGKLTECISFSQSAHGIEHHWTSLYCCRHRTLEYYI
ncbi:MAG: hypothetical protein WAM14_00820 [Candidatus Nitrosopolaris sp.]